MHKSLSTAVGHACQNDDDDDGFNDSAEPYVRTDPLDACPDNLSDPSWPLDINNDGLITATSDSLNFRGRIGAVPGAPNWWVRMDFNMDNAITITGDVLLYRGKIGQTCT